MAAAHHLECEPAAEFALEREREPEPCQRVDEVEGVDPAEPDWPESDVRDQTVGDLLGVAFLGGVEEVGCDPIEVGARFLSLPESMPDTGSQPSRFGRYDERIEELVGAFSDQVERIGGKALDDLAATAKRLAQRLEDVAEQARLKREKENADPEPAEHSERASPEINEPSTNE